MFASPEVELDLRRFELRRGGSPAKLEKQPLELLIFLARRRGNLVTREEIAAHLWHSNGVHVDAEQSIHSAIRKIRLALDDDPQTPRYIETVVGKGYRFIGAMRIIDASEAPAQLSRGVIAASAITAAAVVVAILFLRLQANTPHTPNAAAREACLRAAHFSDQRNAEALRKSVAYYRLAIRADPAFAAAHAGLANSLIESAAFSGQPAATVVDEALDSARLALTLDSNLGDAHAIYGWLLGIGKWQWRDARNELERAVRLSPNSALVHQRYSLVLIATGEVDAAVREARRAHELEPVSIFFSRTFAQTLFLDRKLDESLREFRRAEDLDPRNPITARCLDNIYAVEGKNDDAVSQDLNYLEREGIDPALLASLRAASRSGWRAYWARVLELPLPGIHQNAWARAVITARLGRDAETIQLLERAVDRHELWVTWLGVDPLFDGVRKKPEFQRLLRRMNLPT